MRAELTDFLKRWRWPVLIALASHIVVFATAFAIAPTEKPGPTYTQIELAIFEAAPKPPPIEAEPDPLEEDAPEESPDEQPAEPPTPLAPERKPAPETTYAPPSTATPAPPGTPAPSIYDEVDNSLPESLPSIDPRWKIRDPTGDYLETDSQLKRETCCEVFSVRGWERRTPPNATA